MTPQEKREFEELKQKMNNLLRGGESLVLKGVRSTVPYAGKVNSGGTAIKLPDGWTSSRQGNGKFTVTHNLGHSNYAVVAIVDWHTDPTHNNGLATIEAYGSTDFQINTINQTTNTDYDYDFHFILATIPVI